jgi:hypothetical protein
LPAASVAAVATAQALVIKPCKFTAPAREAIAERDDGTVAQIAWRRAELHQNVCHHGRSQRRDLSLLLATDPTGAAQHQRDCRIPGVERQFGGKMRHADRGNGAAQRRDGGVATGMPARQPVGDVMRGCRQRRNAGITRTGQP